MNIEDRIMDILYSYEHPAEKRVYLESLLRLAFEAGVSRGWDISQDAFLAEEPDFEGWLRT